MAAFVDGARGLCERNWVVTARVGESTPGSRLRRRLGAALSAPLRPASVAGIVGVLAAAVGFPGSAGATTVVLGPTVVAPTGMVTGCASGCISRTVVAESLPGGLASAPAAGVITAWRVRGVGQAGDFQLVVLGDATGTGYTSRSFSTATAIDGTANPVSLSVQAGDRLGLTLFSSMGGTGVDVATSNGAGYRSFEPAFVSVPQSLSSTSTTDDQLLQYNADLLLAPVVSSLSPAGGLPAGGTEVTISGQYLDDATQVHFGSAPAASLTVDSSAQIRATAPAGIEGLTVDVTVTGPGGTSGTSNATKYTYSTPQPGAPVPPSFAGTKSAITVNRKRRFRCSFGATPALTGTATFKSAKKIRLSRRSTTTKRLTFARKSFTVPASGNVTLSIRLSKKKFRILKLNRRIRTRLTVTLENTAGLTSTASKKPTLKAPQRR